MQEAYLVLRVPLREVEENTREKGRFHQTQNETESNHTARALGLATKKRDQSPCADKEAQIPGRSSTVVKQEI